VPLDTFEALRAEIATLRNSISAIRSRTLRDELLRERIRALFRSWVTTVRPRIETFLESKRDFFKLSAELEALAQLTSKFKPVEQYRKRLNRANELINALVLYLPASQEHITNRLNFRGDLFLPDIPDLPIALIPNSIIGWRSKIETFLSQYPFDQSVFIMIRYRPRNSELIKTVKKALESCGLNGILASEHNLTDDLYNPIACLLACARGLAIYDEPEIKQEFNPNVAYELGMMHLLGREYKILKHNSLKVLHTDILMKLYLEYNSIAELETHINSWLKN
jgi:hypothetical protein